MKTMNPDARHQIDQSTSKKYVAMAKDPDNPFRDRIVLVGATFAESRDFFPTPTGLMAGVELVADRRTKAPALGVGVKVIAEARRRGLITRMRTGQAGDYPIGDTICLAPPLVVTEAQVDRMVAILRDAIAAATA